MERRSMWRSVSIAGSAGGAALCLLLLFRLGPIDGVPGYLPFALLGVVALTAWREEAGLFVLALLVPLASWAGRGWNFYVAWPEVLVVAFATGWFVRGVVRPGRPADDLTWPLRIASILVLSSLAVGIAIQNWRMTGGLISVAFLQDLWTRYFVVKANADAIDAAMRLLESLLLLRAASHVVQRRAETAPLLASSVALGATIAAGVNLGRLSYVAQRVESPLAYLATIRDNVHYADLNAAGSYFVMVLFVAIGLALQRREWRWAGSAVVIALALWITGSRTALVAGLIAAAIPIAYRLRHMDARFTRAAAVAASVLLVGCAGAAAYYLPHRGNQRSSSAALEVRWEMAQTSLKMTAAHPVFGAGVGKYYDLSGRFSSPRLLELFPPAQHENAHNNFLQILAELGIAGFAAFLWLLWLAARRIAAVLRADAADRLTWGVATGLLAFVLTWLGGHPLLIDPPAFTFWILLGTAAGWGGAVRVTAAPRALGRRLLAAAAAAIVLMVPVRTRQMMAETDMEHAGFGLSRWESDADGVRYRASNGRSTVFLPGDARVVTVPLRAAEAGRSLQVTLRLDGRPADVVHVPADRWFELRLFMPETNDRPRFHRLDVDVAGSAPRSPDARVIMIGKVEPR